jgi:hypothetical protein
VQAAELAQLDLGDHGVDEAPAAGLLFLAVAHSETFVSTAEVLWLVRT